MKRILTFLVFLVIVAAVPAQTATTGLVIVRVPRDARLHVDDVFCPLPGEARSFETPPLEPGRRYYYTLKVEITVDGKPVRVSRRADVQAGKTTEVNFGNRDAIIRDARVKVDPPPGGGGPPMLPQSLPPLPGIAHVEGQFLLLTRPIFQQVEVVEKRIRDVGGKKEQYEVKVTKTISKPVTVKATLASVRAMELPAREIAADKLPIVLAKETNVWVCQEERLDPFYARTMKAGTLILFMQAQPQGEPIKPPPPPVEENRKTERPGGEPPMVIKAWHKDGFIVWKDHKVVFKEVVRKIEVEVEGKKVLKEVTEIVPETIEMENKVEVAKAKGATVGGTKVDADELARRLATPTHILLLWSDEPPSPFQLQLYDDDVLIVVVPPSRPVTPEGGAS